LPAFSFADAVGIDDELVERTGILRSLDGSKHSSQGRVRSIPPALVANLPPFPGNTWTSSKSGPGPIASPCTKRRQPDRCCPSPRRLPSTPGHAGRRLHGRRTRPGPYRRASPQQCECSSTDGHSNARIRLEPLNRVPKTFGKRWATRQGLFQESLTVRSTQHYPAPTI
jgi:hypothetical protein